VPLDRLEREMSSCEGCGSTPRFRGVVHALSLGLFGESLPIPRFPQRLDLRGFGLSDWEGYASGLARKLDYTNTFLHIEPRLDIADIDRRLDRTLDFVISSEVFEHVAPPVGRAFVNAARLLTPGGVFVLTVPYSLGAATVEHFPGLGDYEIVVDESGERVLETRAPDGQVVRYANLVFHGGVGATLEMRVFALASIEAHLREAGFQSIEVLGDEPRYGIVWPQPWSRPILAIRGANEP
jgi:SAM-dependent methyltransferase